MVEKMIKGPQIHPNKGHLYAESNAVAIKAIYYGINIKTRKKGKCKHSSIDQAP